MVKIPILSSKSKDNMLFYTVIKISPFIQKYSTFFKSKVSDLSKFDGTYFHVWKFKIQLYINSEKLKDIV